MNAREKVRNLLEGKPFARAGFHDHIWEEPLRGRGASAAKCC